MRPILALTCLFHTEQERAEEESSVGDARCHNSGYPVSTFLFGFADYFCLIFTNTHFYEALSLCSICAICSYDSVGMLKSLREILRVSLYRFFWPPWEPFPTAGFRLAKRSTDILVTWPVHLNCASFRRVCTLCISALSRTCLWNSGLQLNL